MGWLCCSFTIGDGNLRRRDLNPFICNSLGQLIPQLKRCEPGGPDLGRHQRQGNISRLVHAHIARKLGYVEDFHAQQIAATDHVLALFHIGSQRELRDTIIGFRRNLN